MNVEVEYRVSKKKANEEMMKELVRTFALATQQRDDPQILAYGNDDAENHVWHMVFRVPTWWTKRHEVFWDEFRQRMEKLAEPPLPSIVLRPELDN